MTRRSIVLLITVLASACASGGPGAGFSPAGSVNGETTEQLEDDHETDSNTTGEPGTVDDSDAGTDTADDTTDDAASTDGSQADSMGDDCVPVDETCNVLDDDCDGARDEGLDGCLVGVHRSFNLDNVEHLYTTSLAEATSGGFALEAEDYFRVYADPHPGLVALNRCIKANGKSVYNQNPNCGGLMFAGVLGYVSEDEVPGSHPLHRLYLLRHADHVYVTDEAEIQTAMDGFGYTYEGIAAYVF